MSKLPNVTLRTQPSSVATRSGWEVKWSIRAAMRKVSGKLKPVLMTNTRSGSRLWMLSGYSRSISAALSFWNP